MAERPTLRLIPNEEQAMLAETARKLVEGRAKVARLRDLREPEHPTGYSRELYAEMVELGFTSLAIPEEFEGLGLGLFDLAQILESLGRESSP
jgi:alkylation response protein AidB-like acyl-CoA dehydrogenase